MLAEWHLTPEYIFANWTDEEFILMIEKLAERKKREAKALGGKSSNVVPEEQLFSEAGIKVIKHGD